MPPGEPDTTAVLTVMLAVPPGLTDWLAGDRLSEKSLWPVQDWVEESTPGALARADLVFGSDVPPWCSTDF